MITIKIKLSFSLLYENGGSKQTPFNQKSPFITHNPSSVFGSQGIQWL